jgi:hypothetical protein
VAELRQRLGFDLTYAFARDSERLTHLFQGPRLTILKAETHLDHALLPLGQGVQHRFELFL